MPELELRRAGPADAAAIAALTREAYAKWIPVIGRAPKPMTADYEAAVQAHRIELLYADGALAALVECILEPDHLLIENLAVSPAQQGRGYGRRMLARAEDIARDLGLAEVRLYTNKLFGENIAFYRSQGYRFDGESAFKGGFIAHMSRRICEPFAT
jgi:ribosomal protein S18 acetylase RimI-like enzyme